MSKNVVIIGQSGVGKSSLINMICPGANAPTSNDTTGCTRAEKGYTCNLGGQLSCQVYDTIGLEQGFWGFLSAPKAKKRLKTYLKDSRERWHLLVYCIPGSRGLKKSHARNFKKFKSVADKLGVPVVVVVTNLEDFRGPQLGNWWSENLEMLTKLGIPGTTEHACITALPKVHLRSDQAYLYDKSCENVKTLIRSILQDTRDRTDSANRSTRNRANRATRNTRNRANRATHNTPSSANRSTPDSANSATHNTPNSATSTSAKRSSAKRNRANRNRAKRNRATRNRASSDSSRSFLDADAMHCPHQFGSADELSPIFSAGMEAYVASSPTGGAHRHYSTNALLLTRLSSFLPRFRPKHGEATEPPQPSRLSAFHPHSLHTRLSSLIHRSSPDNDASDELQQPSTPSLLDPHVLLARLSSFLPRPRLGTDEEAELHPTTPLSSRPDALISRLSSLFRSQPHTNEDIELPQRPSRPRVVEVAAVRDKQTLVVARGPHFQKAKRAYEQQTQLHGQAQASSSHTQPATASISAIPPAPAGTSPAQSLVIQWWTQIVLFLCCVSPSHANSG